MNMRATLFVAAMLLCACSAKRIVMPWMCLERCGENIPVSLKQMVSLGPSVVPYVSIEAYDLDFNATIKDCGYSRVGPALKEAGISVHPMITTANIVKCRDLWKNPEKFIEQAMVVARKNRAWMDGFNIDFEPERGDPPTHDDAVKYANFLQMFAKALHAEGFKITCDIASWSALWENELLAQLEVDFYVTMATYAVNFESFKRIVDTNLRTFTTNQLAIGLQTLKKFTAADIEERLNYIRSKGITSVGIWMTPLPEEWIPLLRSFVNDA